MLKEIIYFGEDERCAMKVEDALLLLPEDDRFPTLNKALQSKKSFTVRVDSDYLLKFVCK